MDAVDLIVTDQDRHDLRVLRNAEFDLAYGTGDNPENDFQLDIIDGSDDWSGIGKGSLVYADGSGEGGIVDSVKTSHSMGVTKISYCGRSWQGVLADRVIAPPSGQDYRAYNTNVGQTLKDLISSLTLTGLFKVVDTPSTAVSASGHFDRYATGWAGVVKLLEERSLKPVLRYANGIVEIRPMPADIVSGVIDSDRIGFDATRTWLCANHIIGLGKGQLKNRIVVHKYADGNGNISGSQTFKGVDEIACVYDDTNAERADLEQSCIDKLKELQGQGSITVSLAESSDRMEIGDKATATDTVTGLSVTAPVTKRIVKYSGGVWSETYEIGSSASGGGMTYSAATPVAASAGTTDANALFLAAHPVGSLYFAATDATVAPSSFGGSWTAVSYSGGKCWKRTA